MVYLVGKQYFVLEYYYVKTCYLVLQWLLLLYSYYVVEKNPIYLQSVHYFKEKYGKHSKSLAYTIRLKHKSQIINRCPKLKTVLFL